MPFGFVDAEGSCVFARAAVEPGDERGVADTRGLRQRRVAVLEFEGHEQLLARAHVAQRLRRRQRRRLRGTSDLLSLFFQSALCTERVPLHMLVFKTHTPRFFHSTFSSRRSNACACALENIVASSSPWSLSDRSTSLTTSPGPASDAAARHVSTAPPIAIASLGDWSNSRDSL